MEWYILVYSYKEKKVIPYNIFENSLFVSCLKILLRRFEVGEFGIEDFRKKFRDFVKEFFEREYEFSAGHSGNFREIDAWAQLEPNLEVLLNYIESKYFQSTKIPVKYLFV